MNRILQTALIVLLSGAALPAATDPAAPGPFAPGMRTLDIPATQGASLTTDVHFPESAGEVDPAAGACPLLVFGHGFSSNRGPYVNHGAHWASRGYITLIPDMAGFSDHSRNADDLVALVDWALAENADPASWLFGRIDPDAIGSTGHSAGGLSSLVAAARDARIRAVAPFDPVDNNGLGAGLVGSIQAPVAVTFSEDHPCNANGSARDLYAAASPVKLSVLIVGANHCDPLDPSNFGCELVCGAADPGRQESYRRYVTGWFEFWLRCDPTYFDWVYGTEVQADIGAGIVSYQADPDPGPLDPCAGRPPGEVPNLRVSRSENDLPMTWDPSPGTVDEYRLYRAGSADFTGAGLRGTFPSTEGTDTGAVDGEPLWFYQVRAANAAGEGP